MASVAKLLFRDQFCVTISFFTTLPVVILAERPFGSSGKNKMEKQAQNIQDSFLNNARKEKSLVAIYLLSGVKLSGRIKSFDKYSLVLETNNQDQLIFKHAISTVVTGRMPSHSVHAPLAAGAHVPGAAPAAAVVGNHAPGHAAPGQAYPGQAYPGQASPGQAEG